MRRTLLEGWKGILPAALLMTAVVLWGCAPAPEPDAPNVAESAGVAAIQPAAVAPASETSTEPNKEPGAEPAGAAAPGAGSDVQGQVVAREPPALALAAPSELLDSYRVAASLVVTSAIPGDATHVESTQVQGEWMRSAGPFGFDSAFTLTNSSGDRRQDLSLVAIDDDAAVRTEGAWSTIRRDAAMPYGSPDSLLALPYVAHINRGENLGRENLDGVAVTHYRLADPELFAAAVQDIWPGAAHSVQSVLLEGWVADAGYVVKYVLRATLDNADFVDDAGNHIPVQQEIDANYLLSDVDAVPAIEWPADAQPPETIAVPGFVPSTFPLPEGATATPRLGMVEIRAPQSEAETAAFYRARLAELGWSFEGELGFYSAAKDGQVIRLTILPDEASGGAQVRVFASPQ